MPKHNIVLNTSILDCYEMSATSEASLSHVFCLYNLAAVHSPVHLLLNSTGEQSYSIAATFYTAQSYYQAADF